MKPLLIVCLLLVSSLVKAQVSTYASLEEQISAHILKNQWEEIIVLAPELTKLAPARGEGEYYTAMAMYKVGQEQRALEHLEKAKKLADENLLGKISQLVLEMQHNRQQVGLTNGSINRNSDLLQINGYAQALEDGQESLKYNDFHKAISDFNKALSYKPSDAEARRFRSLAVDELAWEEAKKANTIAAYEQYVAGDSLRNHTTEAQEVIQKQLLFYGDKYAKEKDVIQMENFLDKYLREYPDGPDAGKAKEIKCKVYFENGKVAATVRDYNSQAEALSLFTKVQELCPDSYALDTEILTAQRLKTRFGRPDRFFFAFVHDAVSTYGFSYGTINTTGIGLYVTARANADIFKYGSYFTVNNSGDIKGDVYGDVKFTGTKSAGNTEGVFGFTKKLTYPFWIYAGGGAAYNPVYWEAEMYNGSGNFDETEWARNTEATTWKPVIELGLITDVGGFNLRGGVKTQDFAAWNVTLGIGFSVKR
ncbi:hypothetical protein ACSX1A_05585 [Pontibacter sp. MBLB2868]|uniref:tetratricopeptide repeat protein n=1 Tax=Pontibacter sp. MBLB2868 TaxID=3451555 RepID=UPI003F756801